MDFADRHEGVEERSGFLWVGNHLCLDLVNTEKIRQGERVDLWQGPEDLLAWLKEAGQLSEGEAAECAAAWQEQPDQGEETLGHARAFRSIARRIAGEAAETGLVSDELIAAINEPLRARMGVLQVARTDEGHLMERFEVSGAGEGKQMLASAASLTALLAGTAANLLCHADLTRVKHCENQNCILFFYDTSKNHTRRWCSMSGCGNRAKASAHYQRRRATRTSN